MQLKCANGSIGNCHWNWMNLYRKQQSENYSINYRWIFHFLSWKLKNSFNVFHAFQQIRDLDLGAQFPEIRQMKVMDTNLHETGHLDNIELVLDIHYLGNFHVSIDADMVLGKKGFLSIRGLTKNQNFILHKLFLINSYQFSFSQTSIGSCASSIHPRTIHSLVIVFSWRSSYRIGHWNSIPRPANAIECHQFDIESNS